MKKKYLGIICLIYSGIIIYIWKSGNLNNFLAPNMQYAIKLSIIPMLIMGLVLISIKRIHYHFRVSDLILLLPCIMLIFANDGRLTESLASNRNTSFVRTSQIIDNEREIEEDNNSTEEYDFKNVDFDIKDDIYDELANYISYGPKANKFNGKTIRVRGFTQKDSQYTTDEQFLIGKYSVTCCTADAGYIGFFIKGLDLDKIKNNSWYEIEGILEEDKDKDGYNIMAIHAVNIKKIKKEEQYIYPCYSYGNNACKKLEKYDLEY